MRLHALWIMNENANSSDIKNHDLPEFSVTIGGSREEEKAQHEKEEPVKLARMLAWPNMHKLRTGTQIEQEAKPL